MLIRSRRGRFRPAVTALGVVVAAGLVTGCGASATDGAAADSSPEDAATSESAFPRTVTHDQGQTEIESRPQRVVALDPSLVEAVVALEVPLVGGIGAYGSQSGFPDHLGDAVADTQDVGPLVTPNLEAVAALQPDLIVSASVRHEALYEQLSAIAPTVFVQTPGATWKDNIRLMAEATGTEDRAEELLGKYEERAEKLGAAINEKAGNPTVSMVRFLDGPARVYTNDSFSGRVFQDMGLARPPVQNVDGRLEIGEEEIRKADADYIFVAVYSGGEESAERYRRNPLWQELEGVKAGNVYEVDDAIWMNSVSLQGAGQMMDDMADIFGVDPAG